MNSSTIVATGKAGGCAVVLAALRLAEERACSGYLVARQAMTVAARRGLSLLTLSEQHPERSDFAVAAETAAGVFRAAQARTNLAYERYRTASLAYDTAWTATVGRERRVAVAA